MQCPSPRLHLFTIQHSSTHYFIIFGTVPKILNLKSTLCRRKQLAAHLFNTLHWCNLSFPNNLHFFGDYLISRLFSTAAFPSYGLWSPDIKPYSPSTFHFSLLWFEYEMSPIGPGFEHLVSGWWHGFRRWWTFRGQFYQKNWATRGKPWDFTLWPTYCLFSAFLLWTNEASCLMIMVPCLHHY